MATVNAPLTDLTERAILILIYERLQIMSTQADSAAAAEAALSAKVDLLLIAFAAGRTAAADLRTQIAALQAQVADLIANGTISAADAAELTALAADAVSKSAAIDAALTPAP